MIYIFDDISSYTAEMYLQHLNYIPQWRKRKSLSYKNLRDRKNSAISFVLLMYALKKEYGITEINEFSYNEFGKPFIEEHPVFFSISHCKTAIVCAVSENNIGVDAECINKYSYNIAKRVCSEDELFELEKTSDPDSLFGEFWTTKEAISKFEGYGLSMGFSSIKKGQYNIESFSNKLCSFSVCYGKVDEIVESMDVEHVSIEIIDNWMKCSTI